MTPQIRDSRHRTVAKLPCGPLLQRFQGMSPERSRKRPRDAAEGGGTDWVAWHREYEDPESRLSQRLREVQRQLAAALDRAPPGPIRIISACAGEGRDVIPVLETHPRGRDVTARLVELDPALAERARANAPSNVEVVVGDASVTDAFTGLAPAQIALFCGVFGNITNEDVKHTIDVMSSLLASGGEVLWTRHRMEPDLTIDIRRWFGAAGYEEMAFTPDGISFGVGTHRLVTSPAPFDAGMSLFEFVGQ